MLLREFYTDKLQVPFVLISNLHIMSAGLYPDSRGEGEKMKKRALCLLMAVMMIALSGLCLPAFGEEPQAAQEEITSICEMNGELYAISGCVLTVQSDLSADRMMVLDLDDAVSEECINSLLLVTDNEYLYILSPYEGKIFRLCKNKLEDVVNLEIGEIGRPMTEDLRYVIFSDPVIIEDQLYVLSLDPETYQQKELIGFSLETGECSVIETESVDLMEMTFYKDSMLLVRDGMTDTLAVLDPKTGMITDRPVVLPDYECAGVVWDDDNDEYYFVNGMKVMKGSGESFTQIGLSNLSGYYEACNAVIWNGQYTVLSTSGICYTCEGNTRADESVKLTLWYTPGSFPDTSIFQAFMKENPGVMIENVGSEDSSVLERLMVEVMTSDGTVDLFMLPTRMIDSQTVFDKGFAAPITSQSLIKDIGEMAPQVREQLILNQKIYAFPAVIYADYETVRTDLLEEAGIKKLPDTMEEYIELMLEWYENFFGYQYEYTFSGKTTILEQQLSTAMEVFIQYIISNADNMPLSFDKPEIHRCMEKLYRLSEYKDHENAGWGNGSIPALFDSYLKDPLLGIDSSEKYIAPPVLEPGKDPIIPASLEFFIINPKSQNKDLAEKFIEFYSQHMDNLYKYYLYPDYNEPEETQYYRESKRALDEDYALFEQSLEDHKQGLDQLINDEMKAEVEEHITLLEEELKELEHELDELETNRYRISPEGIAEFRSFSSFINLKHRHLVWNFVEEYGVEKILQAYFEGEKPLDDMLRELSNRAMLEYYENQ